MLTQEPWCYTPEQIGKLTDWQIANVYEIYPVWRHRYAEGVTHNTEHVFGLTVPAGIKICVERGWVGFKPEWLKNDGGSNGTGNQGPMSAPDRVRAAIAARETGSAEGGRTLEHQ